MSGAARSSMTLGFHGLPQNSVNHRPTMALFCLSFGEPPSAGVSARVVDATPSATAAAAAAMLVLSIARRVIESGAEAGREDLVILEHSAGYAFRVAPRPHRTRLPRAAAREIGRAS